MGFKHITSDSNGSGCSSGNGSIGSCSSSGSNASDGSSGDVMMVIVATAVVMIQSPMKVLQSHC